jgi:AcrR family transcriptional regulator
MTNTGKPRKRGRYHHGNLPAALVQAALELVEESGAEALTLREVARRVGVTHAAPYRHFKDKAALLAAVAEEGFLRLRRELHERMQRAATPRAKVAAAGVAYMTFAREHAAHFRVMFVTDVVDDQHDALERAATGFLDDIAAAVTRTGFSEAGESRRIAELLWCEWHGIASLSGGGWLTVANADVEALADGSARRLTLGQPMMSGTVRIDGAAGLKSEAPGGVSIIPEHNDDEQTG